MQQSKWISLEGRAQVSAQVREINYNELNYEEDLRSLALWLLLCLSFWFVAFQLVLDGMEGSLYAYTCDREPDGRKSVLSCGSVKQGLRFSAEISVVL